MIHLIGSIFMDFQFVSLRFLLYQIYIHNIRGKFYRIHKKPGVDPSKILSRQEIDRSGSCWKKGSDVRQIGQDGVEGMAQTYQARDRQVRRCCRKGSNVPGKRQIGQDGVVGRAQTYQARDRQVRTVLEEVLKRNRHLFIAFLDTSSSRGRQNTIRLIGSYQHLIDSD